jgi:hypothetical protein
MIFDILKQRWLRKEILLLENNLKDRNPNWPQSMVVLFDVNYSSDITIFKKWCDLLKVPLENLTFIAFTKDVKKDKIDGVTLYDSNVIKWNGGIKDKTLLSLLDAQYDLQINYFEKAGLLSKYISMKLDARFKVGHVAHDEATFDLAVNVSLKDHELFITEIIKYLKIITS